MNEAVNPDSVNQHHQISIKYFPIEFNIDGINKYDYVSIERFNVHDCHGSDTRPLNTNRQCNNTSISPKPIRFIMQHDMSVL